MKNFRKYVLVTVAMIMFVMFLIGSNAFASAPLQLLGGNNAVQPANNAVANEAAQPANNTVNTAGNNVPLITPTNNINKNVTKEEEKKDLPQTGENDTYVVMGIGIVALTVGGIAFVRSKKYEM